jgi:adenylate kinase
MIILMGVAGSGKSLQGRLLASSLGYSWVSTGEIFRNSLSDERHKELNSGKLLDDKEVIALVENTLKTIDDRKKIILDGFPRTIVQAEWLISQIHQKKFEIEKVFNLIASHEVVKERLLRRGRDDDNEEVIKERFGEYDTKTMPIIKFFIRNNIKVHEINSDQKPDLVHREIMAIIKNIS